MTDVFLKIIEQLNSSVFILLMLLLVAFIIVYKAWRIWEKISGYDSKHLNSDIQLNDIKNTLHDISAKINIVYENFVWTVRRQSPVSLTEMWSEISKDLSIEKIVDSYWSNIKSELEKNDPKNAYDIQVASMDLIDDFFEENFSEEDKNLVKDYAFKKGYSLLQIFPIIWVIVRDRYLKEKWFDLSEVDKHDPKKKKHEVEKL